MAQAPSYLSEAVLQRLSRYVADHLGLHFPPERWSDMERGIVAAAKQAEVASVVSYAAQVLDGARAELELEMLSRHLTIGETYFFREQPTFDFLQYEVFPPLIAERRAAGRHLSVWSAGCATGEEPYSIAILLSRLIPDLQNWRITILGTDLNAGSLEKARAGIYGEWSFRTAPPWAKGAYFSPVSDGRWMIAPSIQKLVRFARVNLAAATLPLYTRPMDVILCRHVLMYLTAESSQQVVSKFYRSLKPGGFLIVSPVEVSQKEFSEFQPVVYAGATFYRAGKSQPSEVAIPRALNLLPVIVEEPEEAPTVPVDTPEEKEDQLRLAREYADQGDLSKALRACDISIAREPIQASAHFLRATILDELGQLEEAVRALRKVLYLDPRFVIAHFALGNYSARRGRMKESLKHYENSLRELSAYNDDVVLPESGGLTASQLRELLLNKLHGNPGSSA